MVPRLVRRERRYCLAMCAVVLVLFTVAHWRSYTILTKESNRNTLVRSKLLVKDLKNRKNTSRGLRPRYVAHSVITDAICSVKGVSFSASCHEGIIGVPSHDIVKYQPNAVGQFICRDGVLNISWSAVNDDYCDCNDGSDEPGTGACANTRFYCIPQRKYIPSSRVNDGICDCCDGSDEWKRLVVGSDVLTQHNFNIIYSPCKNFCPEKG